MAPRLRAKSFRTPDEVREFPGMRIESVLVGDATVGHCSFQPGWRWSVDLGPALGAPSCPMRHLGYCLSGTMRVLMDDGEMLDIGAHTVFEVPPGHDKWVVGDEPWVAVEWGGSQRASRAAMSEGTSRVLATVVFTDIVGSTSEAVAAGDAAWREVLAAHNLKMRERLNEFRGLEVNTTGDGLLAMFDSPARAVRCAAEMVRAAAALGPPIRVGVHTGEVERVGEDIRGVSVHTAARVMALGRPGEVLVSATTASLLEGSGLDLEDAGSHSLKGIPGTRRVFRLVAPDAV